MCDEENACVKEHFNASQESDRVTETLPKCGDHQLKGAVAKIAFFVFFHRITLKCLHNM